MNWIATSLCALCGLGAGLLAPRTDAAVPPAPTDLAASAAQDPQTMADMMARAKKFTQPGKAHELLQRFVGTWRTENRLVMGGRKGEPDPGEVTFSWLMEGRWLQSRATGSFMGQKMQGAMWLGHDNFKKSYVMTSVSSMDTAMLRAEGDLTQHGDALILYGTLDEYLTGEHDKMVKYVYRFHDADHFTLEIHDLPIGETNTLVVQIDHHRKAD